MLSTRLLSRNNEVNSLIIKDIDPHSMSDEDRCSCTCSFCPNIFDWCIKDAFGLVCVIFTWILFFYAEFVIVFVILIPKNHSFEFNLINLLIFHFLEFFAISSHYRTTFSNPGAVPLNNATSDNLLIYGNETIIYRCTMCQSIKPSRAHHCRICKRCIRRMDHHCIFVNNCVGENNQKYFILFTFYTCLISIYGMILLSIHIPSCIRSNWKACPVWSPPISLILLIFLALEGLCFGLFTGIMTGIQLYSIYTDTTGIEYFKRKEKLNRERRSFLSSLQIIFGVPISLTWLNPYAKPICFITENDERITFDI